MIFGFIACHITVAEASYRCHLFDNVLGFKTGQFRDFTRHGIGAGHAQICFINLSVCECGGISVTARISACTAISAGQNVSYLFGFFISFNVQIF